MFVASSEVIWLRHLLKELGFPQHIATPLHADNTSVGQIAANPVFHKITKDIEVDCHYIHEAYDDKLITPPHVTTDLQVDDIFTKALPRAKLMLVD